jgi:hypothetical protein
MTMFKHLLIASMTLALATMSFAKGGRPEDKPKPEKPEKKEKVEKVEKVG